jgi:hypothetical protein
VSFLQTISIEDRGRLRKIVKKVHLKNYPTQFINDKEADKLVEAFGEETVYNLIKKHRDLGEID